MRRFLLLVLSIISLQSHAQSSAETSLKLGSIKMASGYYQESIVLFNSAIKQNPKSWRAYLERAKAKLAISESDAAMSDVNKALEISKKEAEIFYVRAKIYNSISDFDKAMLDIDESLKLKPDYKEALAEKILTLYYQKKEEEAIALIEKELKRKESAYAIYVRGILNNINERYSKAVADFTKVLSIDSTFNSFEIYLNRSFAYLNMGESLKSLKDINYAIKLKPGHQNGYFYRGKVYYEDKNYGNAQIDFQKALSIQAHNPSVLFNLGMCYIKVDSISQACKYFHEACKLGNQNACKLTIVHCSKISQ